MQPSSLLFSYPMAGYSNHPEPTGGPGMREEGPGTGVTTERAQEVALHEWNGEAVLQLAS